VRVLFLLFIFALPVNALAQNSVPTMPDALKVLEERGAQSRYLGKKHGLDGWITIFQGQEQYYYVTPDGAGFIMGLMFDKEGEMVTLQQVRELQKQGDGELLDFFWRRASARYLFVHGSTMWALPQFHARFERRCNWKRVGAGTDDSRWFP